MVSIQEREIDRLHRVYEGYRGESEAYHRWSLENPGNQWILKERWSALQSVIHSSGHHSLNSVHILDLGCGDGSVLSRLKEWGAQPERLHGIDLIPERIEKAQMRNPDIQFIQSNAEELPFDSGYFDLVLSFTVFSSIIDRQMAANISNEMWRVLKPGGAVVWYDFRYNNPRNPNVQAMTRDKIGEFFPDFEIRLKTITLLPPLARRLGQLAGMLYPILAAIPPLRTHYIGLLVKPS